MINFMKKIITILIVLCLFLLNSCNIERNIDYELITPESIFMGDTSLDGFHIKLKSGEEIAIDSTMIDEYSNLSFFKEGLQTFTIVYKNVKKSKQIEVVRNKFTGLVFDDMTAKYTGDAITLSVSGNLPGNANVWYKNGNSFVNPGIYEISAVVSLDYYETVELNATLTIEE